MEPDKEKYQFQKVLFNTQLHKLSIKKLNYFKKSQVKKKYQLPILNIKNITT